MMDEEGNRSGYGYDVLRLMARYWDVDYEYVGYDKSWAEMQEMLENGEIDLVTSARRVPEREEKFDFSRPIGTNNGILTVRSDNQRIVDDDFSTYDGMHVAMLKGNSRNKEFAEFARTKGFTFYPVYYDTTEELEEALRDGTVDAIVTSSLRKISNERIVDKFGSSDFYAIVKKGNTELLDQINYAIDQMNAAEGDWKTTLYQKHYGSTEDRNLEYTEEEKELVAKLSADRPLHVLCDPTRYPYSYYEDGEMKGILPDYFRKIAAYAGLSYEFLTPATRDEYIAYQGDRENTDLSIDARLDTDNYAETKEWGITAPYITMRMARVTRRDFDGNIQVVATVNQTASKSIADVMAPGAEKLMCDTRQDMIEAVRKGKADAAFVYYYMAQAYVNSDTTGTLAYTLMEQPVYQYRIVVSSKFDHALSGILTKAIYAMPDNLVEDIATQYTTYKASSLTLADWISLHPVASILTVLLFAWMLATLIVVAIRLNARKNLQLASQKQAAEMKALAERAESANRAKTTFLSHMSHDMRTPMNAIIGFTNIALKNEPSAEVRNCLEKIEDSSEHLLSLINDVLDLTRVESGKVKYTPAPVQLKTIMDSVLNITKGFLTGRDISLKVQREDAQLPNVLADAVHLQDVMVNILSNAVKFTPDGGTITVEEHCRQKDGQLLVQFTISDTGIGMSEEFTKVVFDEFTQEDNGARTQYHGTGLGMSIVKNYVELMGGTISVESKKNVGTTFRSKLPLEITELACSTQDTEEKEQVELKGLHVLLAEDNDLNAEVAGIQLEEAGMKVTRAVDGKNAVELFRDHPEKTFDLILMDVMMPGMNGYEATHAIRSMPDRPDGQTIPIIAMTANSFVEDVQTSMNAGMNAHLSKPIVISEVMKTISRCMHQR